MKSRQSGFTMIELIVVIVILGILAAVALPKFIDVSSNAKSAALSGVAGAAASAMTINYSGCAVTGHVATSGKCVVISNCSMVGNVMEGGLPSGYSVAASTLTTVNGTEAACTVTQTAGSATAGFTGIAAGN